MDVTVIGGGLAGMAAALRLAERGCDVSLFDAADHLGGKASAVTTGADFDEHGFHIFPAWYRNLWKLIDELGIRDRFIDLHDFQQLRAGEFPSYKPLHDAAAPKNVWRNLTSGLLSFHQTLLFFYSTVDLASFHLDETRRLDQLSITGFLRSRFYRTEQLATVYQDLMLKAISVPSHFVSAMTTKKVIQFWANDPLPMHRILDGNLQERFINPLTERLRQRGVRIYTKHRLTRLEVEGRRIAAIHFVEGTDRAVERRGVDRIVLAVPIDVLKKVCTADVYNASPTLGNVRNLRSRPMAALNLYFTERIPGVPAEHVNLVDSKYGLTFIDVAQHWKKPDGSPVYQGAALNVIATDFSELEGVDEETAKEKIALELNRFIPTLDPAKIVRHKMQHHNDAPLFMNDVGIWRFRPEALPEQSERQVELENLYLAGDYCRSHVDLVSMEGAFTTGLKAAEAVRRGDKVLSATPAIDYGDRTCNRFPFYALWLLGLPVAAAAKLVAILKGEEIVAPVRIAASPQTGTAGRRTPK